jgi:catechol 2,3-dioxygenase-like lactoylglutathione lyase family enzyme
MRGIFHTGITVSDLDRSIAFYRDVLGLKLTVGPTEVLEGDELSRGLGVGKARMKLAIFQIGDGQLELLQYLNPPSPVDRPMPANTLGAMHVAFHVDDMGAKVKELQAKGVTFFTRPNVVTEGPLDGWTWVYFRDPDGITLELIEYKPPRE